MEFNAEELSRINEALKELLDDADLEEVPMFRCGSKLVRKDKNGSKIHIKKKNRGKFTASAKKAGQSVQEHAKSVLNNPNATPLQKKRANFARNAAKWKHAKGGVIKSLENFDAQSFRKWLDENYGQPN